MRKINRTDILKLVLVLAFVGAIGVSMGAIGRFTPTHAIVEPVYCGACHTDQVVELNATTHLPHFAGAILEEAEAIEAGGAKVVTQAEAISGGCMMCHNTWANREKIWLQGYSISDDPNGNLNGQYQLRINDINFKPTTDAVQYDVAVLLNSTTSQQIIRLGTSIVTTTSKVKVTVQDPGTSGVAIGTLLNDSGVDYTIQTTGITLLGTSANVTALNGTAAGTLKIVYQVGVSNGATVTLKHAWGELSARSPNAGSFWNDVSGSDTCGNSEKGVCHAVETAVGKNLKNQMAENQVGVGGAQLGSGNGIYFQHEMAYTSAEYAAKQVKFCGVCHFNKLPPMTADGEPIRQNIANDQVVIRVSHGVELINTTNLTLVSADWAHKQVQCIRCHSHAGIGFEDAITGVRSP